MDDVTARLRELGQATAAELDRQNPALDSARARFLSADTRSSKRRSPVLIAIAAAILVLLGVPALIHQGQSMPIAFEVGSPPTPGVVGQWIASDSGSALEVRFSEGTNLSLGAGSRARVTAADEHGAAILLEKGEIDASFRHRDSKTSWALRAGPFDVQVTGTHFRAMWDPAHDVFDLAMQEGSVAVHGPQLDSGRRLVAGERLHVALRDGILEVRTASSRAEVPDAPIAALPKPAPSDAEEVESPVATNSSAAPRAPEEAGQPSYRKLVADGHFDEALATADRAGFSQVIEQAPLADVSALADAARLGGRPTQAREALLSMRRRFGARGSTSFLLGKIAAEHTGFGDAAVWFETYLNENPNGPLVEQALGRLMELRKRSDPAAAARLARRYLGKFPHGAYATLAHTLDTPP